MYRMCRMYRMHCRRELQQYKFTDDDFEICVICQLEEGVPLEQVPPPVAGWLTAYLAGWQP